MGGAFLLLFVPGTGNGASLPTSFLIYTTDAASGDHISRRSSGDHISRSGTGDHFTRTGGKA